MFQGEEVGCAALHILAKVNATLKKYTCLVSYMRNLYEIGHPFASLTVTHLSPKIINNGFLWGKLYFFHTFSPWKPTTYKCVSHLQLLALQTILTYFSPMFHFYTPENIRKPNVFRRGDMEMEPWAEMGWFVLITTHPVFHDKSFVLMRFNFLNVWWLALGLQKYCSKWTLF